MSELSDKIAELGITMTFKHLGLHIPPKVLCKVKGHEFDHNEWSNDKWEITLHYQGRSFTTSFSTGLGHRVKAPGVKQTGYGRLYYTRDSSNMTTEQAAKEGLLILPKKNGKLIGPDVADVIDCLRLDALCGEQSFTEWCGDLGYNTDSRSALETYLKCQDNSLHMRQLLRGDLQLLEGLEH